MPAPRGSWCPRCCCEPMRTPCPALPAPVTADTARRGWRPRPPGSAARPGWPTQRPTVLLEAYPAADRPHVPGRTGHQGSPVPVTPPVASIGRPGPHREGEGEERALLGQGRGLVDPVLQVDPRARRGRWTLTRSRRCRPGRIRRSGSRRRVRGAFHQGRGGASSGWRAGASSRRPSVLLDWWLNPPAVAYSSYR